MTHEASPTPLNGAVFAPQVIFGMDAQGVCTLSVGPGLELLGLVPNQLVGRDLYALYRDEGLGPEALDAVLTGRRFARERDYHGRRLALHFEPVLDQDGILIGAVGIATDVTVQRETESRARASRARADELAADLSRFKALAEASPDFIAIAALDGTVDYVNPGGRTLIGLALDAEVRTTTIADYLTPEGLALSLEVEQPAVVRHGHYEGETTLKHQNGRAIPVAVASFLMYDATTSEPFALATVQRDISERVAADKLLLDLVEQRTALLTRLVDAQDAERSRIAADVHDDPVQACAAMDLRLGLLRKRLSEQAPQLLSELDGLQEAVSGATDRLRSLLFDLEPPSFAEGGLAGALERAADEIFEGTGLHGSVDGADEPPMPEATLSIAYRIAKEALVNAAKHAHARQVLVTLSGVDDGLQVEVHDDGVGPGSAITGSAPGHRGVSGMQDRAILAGGRCTIGPRPQGGTVVSLWLPGPGVAPGPPPGLGAGLGLALAASRSTRLAFDGGTTPSDGPASSTSKGASEG